MDQLILSLAIVITDDGDIKIKDISENQIANKTKIELLSYYVEGLKRIEESK